MTNLKLSIAGSRREQLVEIWKIWRKIILPPLTKQELTTEHRATHNASEYYIIWNFSDFNKKLKPGKFGGDLLRPIEEFTEPYDTAPHFTLANHIR